MPGDYHVAQVNIALPQAPLDSEQLAGFVERLEPVNALADAAPGFVWRLQTEDGDATGIRAFGDDRLIVNMSVWGSLEALRHFVYRSATRRRAATAQGMVRIDAATHQRVVVDPGGSDAQRSPRRRNGSSTSDSTVPRRGRSHSKTRSRHRRGYPRRMQRKTDRTFARRATVGATMALLALIGSTLTPRSHS